MASIWIPLSAIFVIIHCFGDFVVSEVPRPRGVSISRASLYAPSDTFTCLDGSRQIEYTKINDDFCDCPDGSDEPGTSACPNGVFHCNNAGHRPLNIPSSRVNDGICDCCDAFDEYSSNAQCLNVCSELGKEEREREKLRADLLKRGGQLRAELCGKGKALKTDQLSRLEEVKKAISEAQALKDDRENIKRDAEALEKAAMDIYQATIEHEKAIRKEAATSENIKEAQDTFKRFDSNGNGFLEVAELQTRIQFDRNRDGEVSEEEARFFLNQESQLDLESFIPLSWPRVKPYLMLEAGLFKPPASVDELDTGEQEQQIEQNEQNEQIEEQLEGDEKDNGHHEPLDPSQDVEELEEEPEYEEDETGEGEVEQVETDPEIEYDPDTKQLIEQADEARNQFAQAERELRELENEQRRLQESLEKDYGANEEYAPLQGECFSFEDREYVYKVCPFDRASQQPRSGGAETRLGTWERWDGKPDKYSIMYFTNGAACWNGPQRSVRVQLDCGIETKITSVSEPNRCEYVYTMETPAACITADDRDDTHDEL